MNQEDQEGSRKGSPQVHLFQSYARSKSLHKIAFDFLKFSKANEQQRIKHSQRCGRDLVDTRYADICRHVQVYTLGRLSID